MYKSCSRCGKIHDSKYKCYKGIIYSGGNERKLRSSYAWQKKSQDIREQAQGLCEVCRDQGQITYNNLEVHHIEKLAEHEELLLEDDNLICLCVTHHKQADSGEIDKEYLRQLARVRVK